jgi:tRNA 2-thiouridine synthesizing protein A
MPEYAIERDPLLADEQPQTLAKRVESVLATLATTTGKPCARCTTTVCSHDALASLVLGFHREPRCTDCLGRETMREPGVLRDEIAGYALSKECLTVGWRWASAREPRCGWLDGLRAATGVANEAPAHPHDAEPAYDAEWNAGDLACGELLLQLRLRLHAMAPGSTIKVTALDTAAPEDMPAWCRLTGHALVCARHPIYFFVRRKEN